MKELLDYSAYSASLMPRTAADEVFLLARRVMYLTHFHSTDFVCSDERLDQLWNLNDVSSQNDFIRQYKKIQKDTTKNDK